MATAKATSVTNVADALPATNAADQREALVRARRDAELVYLQAKSDYDGYLYDGQKFRDAEATERAKELLPAVKKAEANFAVAHEALAQHDAQAGAAQQRAEADARAARPRRIAEAAGVYRKSVRRLQAAARELGEATKEHIDAGAALAAALDTQEARRQFSYSFIIERLRYGLYNLLRYEVPQNQNEARFRGKLAPVDVYLDSNAVPNKASKLLKVSYVDAENEMIDNLVPYFDSAADAEAARRRRDPTGETVQVVPDPAGVFALVAGARRAPKAGA